MDLDAGKAAALPGYRLAKLEVFNWGTFDGAVYVAQPRGQTTLLIGENGSGKSTLVDGLLTLLVRPQSRNYNVAAGAQRHERDERTYIRGAHDRVLGADGRPRLVYHRPEPGQFSALLACFSNATSQRCFTVCQVLYLDQDSNVVRIYGFADSERSIVHDLGDFQSTHGLARQMRQRGFRVTTNYKEYFHWLQQTTGFRAKAMDVFNQTVAVKDVQSLNGFIRQHMLEKKGWEERIGQLLKHFKELSDTHRVLVRARQQAEGLRPIIATGARYRQQQSQLESVQRCLEAVPLFFAHQQIRLLEPLIEEWRQELRQLAGEIDRFGASKADLDRDLARLELEIEHNSGERVRALPGLIEQQRQLAKVKATQRRRFELQLQAAGISWNPATGVGFRRLRQQLDERRQQVLRERDDKRTELHRLQFEIGGVRRRISEDRQALCALERGLGNLPESLTVIREAICAELQLTPNQLPFVAELIAVDPAYQAWEPAIEQALYSFARSLLVCVAFYPQVTAHLDRQRLIDSQGQGQRLAYLGVDEAGIPPTPSFKGAVADDCLLGMLHFRPDHPYAFWVQHEIQRHWNYLACESVEQFRRTEGLAMTRHGHFKMGPASQAKDDRRGAVDRRHWVLGWDNAAKRHDLTQLLGEAESDLGSLAAQSQRLSLEFDQLAVALAAIEEAIRTDEEEMLHSHTHESLAHELQQELEQLESSDELLHELRKRAMQLRGRVATLQAARDEYLARRTQRELELQSGEQTLELARRRLAAAEHEGRLAQSTERFAELQQSLAEPLTPARLGILAEACQRELQQSYADLEQQIRPVKRELTQAMVIYLRRFQEDQADLDASLEALPDFEALYGRLMAEDLPKHEERFKSRLNEKVLLELGLLYGGLEADRQEIFERLGQLNEALRLLPWKAGTLMQLEAIDVQDREILDFRRELSGCLTNTGQPTSEVYESTYLRMEKLVDKLRDERNDRWRDKVTDVRTWFDFAAREVVAATGESRSYYDGGAGQSGGEKGKLAFLVLVAAIAYQYNLEPDKEASDRFHFVMVDEMFSRSDDQHAEYALELFDRFGLQLLIVAPLDAKARVTEPYVGTYLHVVKDRHTHRSQLLAITTEELHTALGLDGPDEVGDGLVAGQQLC
jgi:uncharacterized protein YPO0396